MRSAGGNHAGQDNPGRALLESERNGGKEAPETTPLALSVQQPAVFYEGQHVFLKFLFLDFLKQGSLHSTGRSQT